MIQVADVLRRKAQCQKKYTRRKKSRRCWNAVLGRGEKARVMGHRESVHAEEGRAVAGLEISEGLVLSTA